MTWLSRKPGTEETRKPKFRASLPSSGKTFLCPPKNPKTSCQPCKTQSENCVVLSSPNHDRGFSLWQPFEKMFEKTRFPLEILIFRLLFFSTLKHFRFLCKETGWISSLPAILEPGDFDRTRRGPMCEEIDKADCKWGSFANPNCCSQFRFLDFRSYNPPPQAQQHSRKANFFSSCQC